MEATDEIADELLQSVWNARDRIALTYFSAVSGRRSSGKLMIIGRATNGWTSEFFPNELGNTEKRRTIINETSSPSEKRDKCPMSWVMDQWNTGADYNSARSSFWQAAKQLVECLYLVDDAEWPSYLTWTNLYKVSPSDGGNPIGALEEIQVATGARLLASEVRKYRPGQIVFFTGVSWAGPFLEKLGIAKFEQQHMNPEVQYGRLSLDASDPGVPAVIAPHPQGKTRDDLIASILDALQRLGVPLADGTPGDFVQ